MFFLRQSVLARDQDAAWTEVAETWVIAILKVTKLAKNVINQYVYLRQLENKVNPIIASSDSRILILSLQRINSLKSGRPNSSTSMSLGRSKILDEDANS
ncbi:hypothetical protein HZH66_010122 [Vespula vulgaris]|uniref:Uncharacterized protein n=1 Tax=Vespula vulgaris TaxID=7454 RepID=A0A834MY94_VESVU|nr:hypothetical protein HZH66_010122 [Vespula vulgaris]